MNRILSLALAGALSLSLASCMDHNEVPDNSRALITAQQLPAANSTILKVKEKYSTPITGNNTFEEVKEDVIFEGVVVANDISGNLYQTLVLRDIHSTAGADDDQCITVGVKTSTLFPPLRSRPTCAHQPQRTLRRQLQPHAKNRPSLLYFRR